MYTAAGAFGSRPKAHSLHMRDAYVGRIDVAIDVEKQVLP